jgi:hypothetical protein
MSDPIVPSSSPVTSRAKTRLPRESKLLIAEEIIQKGVLAADVDGLAVKVWLTKPLEGKGRLLT